MIFHCQKHNVNLQRCIGKGAQKLKFCILFQWHKIQKSDLDRTDVLMNRTVLIHYKYILLNDPIKGLYFLIFILVLQQLDGNVIGPKILGNSTGLSAFWVVFSILLGGGLFGFVGMIMGVPTFAVVYYIITMLINHLLEKKKLPLQTSEYGEKSYVDDSGRFVRENPEENDTAVKNGENKKERK